MKKIILVLAAAVAMVTTSCSTISHTSNVNDVNSQIVNRTTANLTVSDQVIKYTFTPNGAHFRAGMKSMKAAAVAKALEANGNGDVLINPQFEIKTKRGLFKSSCKYITVTGHVGTYDKFHPTTQAEADIISTLRDGKKCKKECK